MTRGKFIVFEGGEGCGKSTQARVLADMLEEAGHRVTLTREPGGTPGAEAIRNLLLDPPGEGWGARSEAMLFAAARSDHVEKCILPALRKGEWAVCDRFVDSSRAYQGLAGELGDGPVQTLHTIGSDGLKPDLTLILDVPPAILARRLEARDGGNSDAIGGRSAAYHARVAQAFRSFADMRGTQTLLIDGDGSVDQVHQRVLAAIGPMLETRDE